MRFPVPHGRDSWMTKRGEQIKIIERIRKERERKTGTKSKAIKYR